MFDMRPKVLDSVFAARVLGVFVPNLVKLLANARPTNSASSLSYNRLFLKCPLNKNAFLDQFKHCLR